MTTYVIRRLTQLVPVLIVVSIALFVLLRVLPGDPTNTILGDEATAEQRAALRAELGLDQPLTGQYLTYAGQVLRSDFGESYISGQPVTEVLRDRLPVTVQLGVTGTVTAILIGLPTGVLAARRRGGRLDSGLNLFAIAALAVPNFYLAALLILLFAVQLRVLPASGYLPFTTAPVENLRFMLLPTLTVALSMAAVAMRQTRESMISSMDEDFIRTGRSVGLAERRLVMVYGLRHAVAPVVTVMSLQLGAVISASVITETIFTLPGLGSLIVNSIFSRDLPVVQGAVLLVVGFILLINLLTDLIYAWLDPRIVY